MRGFTIGLAAGLAALTAGCSLFGGVPSVPGEQQQDTSQDAQDTPEGPSYAGTWTRPADGDRAERVFDVVDDGTTVHGELRGAADHGFNGYSFDLSRKAGALEGKAKFELADMAGKAFETKWQAKVEGTTILVKAEELAIDEESGDVAERTTVEHTYEFAPAAVAAATPPPMPAMDMSAYVTPAPNYKHLLADDIAVGQWVDVEMEAGGQKSVTRTAVVADTGDAWVIELDNQMNQKDLLLAVFVNKDTGDVVKAFVGNRGKDGTEKAVTPPAQGQAGDMPPTTEEEVSVPAGTFMAKRMDMDVGGSTMSTWTGLEGTDAEGVMLKSVTSAGTDELKVLELTSYEAGGASFDARLLAYTSGTEMTMAMGSRPYLNQVMLVMKTPHSVMKLVGQGEGAEPAFNYPR